MDDDDQRYYRSLLPGQASSIRIGNADGREPIEVFRSTERVFEAPNWTPDGDLLLNADGLLWRMPADGSSAPQPLTVPGLPAVNNDHVLTLDGSRLFASANDGHIYEVPFDGRPARRITANDGDLDMHFLHGVSPDGSTLVYTGVGFVDQSHRDAFEPEYCDIFAVPVDGGERRRLTFGPGAADGSEYRPDGAWIYLNTEAFSGEPGHAQIARMRPDGSELRQLTFDGLVNWFPHFTPDGSRALYLSFPAGTIGHPENRDVELKLVEADGDWRQPRTVARLFGGQGTVNVNSWAPDNERFAFVAYPVVARSPAAG